MVLVGSTVHLGALSPIPVGCVPSLYFLHIFFSILVRGAFFLVPLLWSMLFLHHLLLLCLSVCVCVCVYQCCGML